MRRSDYAVVVNEFRPAPWANIFSTREFFEIHRTPRACYLQLVSRGSGRVLANIHFAEVAPGEFRSPRLGTFGGFNFERLPRIELVELFADETERVLRDGGAKRVSIVSAPFAHEPELAHLVFLTLFNRGYSASPHSLNHSLPVDAEPFERRIDADGRRRLKRARELGLATRKLESVEELRASYELILDNTRRKGYELSMTWEAVRQMIETFPERLFGFGAFEGERLVASSLNIRVSPQSVYVFYWGDAAGYSGLSPIVLLAETIYGYAAAVGARWMDIGTSTNDGEPNYGLIHFKKNLGCRASLKLLYTKTLD